MVTCALFFAAGAMAMLAFFACLLRVLCWFADRSDEENREQ